VAVQLLCLIAMTPDEMKRRTKKFALDIIRFTSSLPAGIVTEIILRQLIRAGTGTAANYRAACRRKSDKDFIMKMTNAEEEADESAFWLEVIIESGLARPTIAARLLDEADQLTRIFVASINTTRTRMHWKKKQKERQRIKKNPEPGT
jgi:four helix bundle protein